MKPYNLYRSLLSSARYLLLSFQGQAMVIDTCDVDFCCCFL